MKLDINSNHYMNDIYKHLSLFFNKDLATTKDLSTTYRKIISLISVYNPDFDKNTVGVIKGNDLIIGQYTLTNINVNYFIDSKDPIILTKYGCYTTKNPEYYDYNIETPYFVKYEPVPAYKDLMSELRILSNYKNNLTSSIPEALVKYREQNPQEDIYDLPTTILQQLKTDAYEKALQGHSQTPTEILVEDALKDFELE